MASQGIYFNLFARDGVSPVFARVGASAQALGEKVNRVSAIGNALKFAGIVGVGEAFAHSIESATKFQSAMTRIHTQAGVAQGEIGKLSKGILAMAGPTATAPEELATSLYHVESTISKTAPASQRMAKALQEVKIAAEGAKIGNADLEDVTNALNATIASGIPGAQNMQQAMGALNATVGAGDMSMQDLADAFSTGFLATVKGFGLDLNDVSAALATFGDNNIRGANAAQALRQAVMAFAKPISTAEPALTKLGLSMTSLAKDMQTGGLNKAVSDLHQRLVATGNAGVKSGQVLIDAFGRKAGTGIQILEDQFTRFQSKVKEVGDGAKGFGDAWSSYTKTASYQFDRLKTTVEAVGIRLGTVLLPAITKVASGLSGFVSWLTKGGTAAKALMAAVGGLVALKGIAATMRIASVAITGISSAFKTARAAMWLLQKDGLKAMTLLAGEIRGGAAASEGALAGVTVAGAALTAGLTLGVGALVGWMMHSQQAKEKAKELRDSLDQTTGAVTKNTAAWLANQLQQDGTFTAARKLGISAGDVEAAILGQQDALTRVNAQLDKYSGSVNQDIELSRAHVKVVHDQADAYQKVRGAVDGTSKSIAEQAAQVRIVSGATSAGNKALNQMTSAQKHAKTAAEQQTDAAKKAGNAVAEAANMGAAAGVHAEAIIARNRDAMRRAAAAAALLRDTTKTVTPHVTALWEEILKAKDQVAAFTRVLNALIGKKLDAQQAFDAFRKGVNDLASAMDKHTKSLTGNTDAAITNRDAVYSQVAAALAHSEAVAKQTNSVDKGRAALYNDLSVLQKHLEKIMGNKEAADKFLASINALPKQVKTEFGTPGLEPAIRKVDGLARAIGELHGKILHITVDAAGNAVFTGSGGVVRANASGGYISGPGTGTSDSIPSLLSNGEYVIRASSVDKYGKHLFDALNAGAYANGGLVNLYGATTGTGAAARAINAAVDHVAKAVENAFTPAYGGGSAGRWASVGREVLAMLGQPAGSLGALLRRIQFESGGNPYAVNRSDINWQQGHPSVGLMQVIAGTFAAYGDRYRGVGPFAYGVSENPYANVYAGANYAIHRYGSVAAIDPRVRPEGYDSGGWLRPGLTLAFNGTGSPERVLAHREYAGMRQASSVVVNVNVSGSLLGATPEQIAAKLEPAVRDALNRRTGRGGARLVATATN